MKESLIIDYLIGSQDYSRQVLPFLKEEYFVSIAGKTYFNIINDHYLKYKTLANSKILEIELDNLTTLNENQYKECESFLQELNNNDTEFNVPWAMDNTEKYCQDRAVYLAIMDSIKIINNENKDFDKNAIPKILEDALAIKFSNNIGHNFLEDSDERFNSYLTCEEKIEFDLEMLNLITEGGFERKSINVFMGSTGTGKTLLMCHMAAAAFLRGYNVLYITMEMAEVKIAKRIESNLLNIPLSDLSNTTRKTYLDKMDKLKSKSIGKLIIKEYPTTGANALHFKHLLEDLKIKKGFTPDIIFIDYINICSSSRLKSHHASNPYIYIKSIAEELRGLAVETNTCIISATQTNRAGSRNSDVEMDNTSDSWGLPQTVDFMAALITNDDLASLQQILVKQLKNRYADNDKNKRFVLGIDKAYMRLYDCDQSAQENIMEDNDTPVMDNTRFNMDDTKDKFSKKKAGSRKKFNNGKSLEEFVNDV